MDLFIAAFVTVFLLVFQQQNVIHRRRLWAAGTSVMITASQFVVIKGVAQGDVADMFWMAAGGVCGVLLSMEAHGWLVRAQHGGRK